MEHSSEILEDNIDYLFFVDNQPSYEHYAGSSKSHGEIVSGTEAHHGASEPQALVDFISIREVKTPEHLPKDIITSEACELDSSCTQEEKENADSPDSLMFIVDREGYLTGQKANIPKYEIRDVFLNKNAPKEKKNKFMNECWNCNETTHSLIACPHPRDGRKIARARKEFQSSRGGNRPVYKRYHLAEGQRFGHLVPGVISDDLAAALGLESGQLPSYIYNMRRLGYPPGWLSEATVSHSGIDLFDGSEAASTGGKYWKNVEDKYDISKLVRYPGFNAPLPPDTYDDSDYWRAPPLSKSQSLEVMVEHLQGRLVGGGYKRRKLSFSPPSATATIVSSQCEPHEMDYEETPDCEDLPEDNCKFVPPLPDEDYPGPPPDLPPRDDDSTILDSSPIAENDASLDELEEYKKKLLAELNDTTPNCATPNSNVGRIKSVDLGTPIIKSISPYSSLPSAEKFSVNICDVINFENLPNSTGKYKQMSSLIVKVRNKLAQLDKE